ncbi:MAG: 2-C-methyl-D-erythritol 4-phosphate cytidylyltransferase [Bacteroidia bacterium]|nr:2-C-methyl-D-erythritol 4-phosphate cytidylyltransferase [Bacteroidia bacterium]
MWIWVQLAAGIGSRFGGTRPKQFYRLGGKPLVAHAVETFLRIAPESPAIIVLPISHFAEAKRLLTHLLPKAALHFVVGGATRSASTEAALHFLREMELLKEPYTIAFHDAARPFPSEELIERTYQVATEKGAAVCGVPVSSSLREWIGETSRALPREQIWEVQTPQAFRGDVLQAAWSRLSPTANSLFTDEGSWVEAAGFPVSLVAGETTNLKITYPIDWEVARAWLRQKKKQASYK